MASRSDRAHRSESAGVSSSPSDVVGAGAICMGGKPAAALNGMREALSESSAPARSVTAPNSRHWSCVRRNCASAVPSRSVLS